MKKKSLISVIIAGDFQTIVILDDHTVKCRGYNGYGLLGYGDTDWRGDGPNEMGNYLPAVDLGTGRTAVHTAAGEFHTVVLLDDGTVKCWGRNNYGQLGYEDMEYRGDEADKMGDYLLPVVLW